MIGRASERGGPSKMSVQSFIPSSAAMKLSTDRIGPAF